MTEFALILQFEDHAAQTLVAWRAGIGQLIGQPAGVPPHLTLAAFSAAGGAAVQARVAAAVGQFAVGPVRLASLGAFIPAVVYAAPLWTPGLVAANRLANALGDAAPTSRYAPDGWQPHVALASHLGPANLNAALIWLTARFTPLTLVEPRLVLIACDPYQELARWAIR
ncbi:2'-5' RNA ligase family protein [Lacticaseibacillus parakribbianus]|uniref:2'-5' RNA ligase family protein n=1 Tax=Lacticaseibacillus parakribbianus TaxID=2970927 RepID=UPI0021CB0A90|nr:2'-5' RNA ligase family protein [Lacticaseibacillus parakribbianus]